MDINPGRFDVEGLGFKKTTATWTETWSQFDETIWLWMNKPLILMETIEVF